MADKQTDWTGYCNNHGKRLYSNRKLARKQIRQHRNSKGMREYPCDVVVGHFHIGHIPLAVVEGRKTSREIYGGKR